MTQTGTLLQRLAATTKTERLASREWQSLLSAIRADAAVEELRRLAIAAAFPPREVAPLKVAVISLSKTRQLAAAAPGLEKKAAQLERDLATLAAQYGQARCYDDQLAAERAIAAAKGEQRRMRDQLIAARLATQRLAAHKAEYGLE